MFETWKAKRLIADLRNGSIRENSDTVDKLRALGEAAVEPLMKAVKSPNYRVKLECIRALGHLGDPRAIPVLEPLLDHKNEIVRQYAEAALRRIRSNGKPSGQVLSE